MTCASQCTTIAPGTAVKTTAKRLNLWRLFVLLLLVLTAEDMKTYTRQEVLEMLFNSEDEEEVSQTRDKDNFSDGTSLDSSD